jgi:hypothetical protein
MMDMVGTLIAVAIFWLAFNMAVTGIAIVRAVRCKKLIRELSIDRLIAAHFASARKASRVTRPLSSDRLASRRVPDFAGDVSTLFARKFASR